MKKRLSIAGFVFLLLALFFTACQVDNNQANRITPGNDDNTPTYTVTFNSGGGNKVNAIANVQK